LAGCWYEQQWTSVARERRSGVILAGGLRCWRGTCHQSPPVLLHRTQQYQSFACRKKKTKQKPNRGPRPTPTGLRPQHPERGGTEVGNAQQHETQAAAREQTESDARAPKRTHTSPQSVVRHRSTNQVNKGGNNGADSITPGAGTALQEGERIQEPGYAVRTNRVRSKGVNMKRQTHALSSERLMWQEVPQVRPEVSGVRATTRGSFATEEIVLNTAPTTFNQRVTPSRSRRGHGDGHLTVGPRTQTMNAKARQDPVPQETQYQFSLSRAGYGSIIHRLKIRVASADARSTTQPSI
jgi:hypothetical protein